MVSLIIEECEDTKGEIRICKSKKYRQHNGQKKKYKQQSTKYTRKTKDRVTQTLEYRYISKLPMKNDSNSIPSYTSAGCVLQLCKVS
jgi:hypothetical protein